MPIKYFFLSKFNSLYDISFPNTFKMLLDKKLDELSENSINNSKEIESLLIEIGETTKRTEFVLEYLKRLDQNASRLADNIQGEQSMTKAIEMAREGKDHLDIIKETGLSHEEVEAIIHSHKE